MKKHPAIALIELASIPVGIQTGDAMLKQAPISILRAGTVHNGKFLVLVGGSVASVEEAYAKGLATGGDLVVDQVILPDVHEHVFAAIAGERKPCGNDALAIIETFSVAAILQATDAAVKGTAISLAEIRLADDIGGKAIAIYAGPVEEVETAVRISNDVLPNPDLMLSDTVIPSLDQNMARQIDHTTSFAGSKLDVLSQGEI